MCHAGTRASARSGNPNRRSVQKPRPRPDPILRGRKDDNVIWLKWDIFLLAARHRIQVYSDFMVRLTNTRPGSAYLVLEVISPSSIRFKRETIGCFQACRIKSARHYVVSLPRKLPGPLFHLKPACLLLKLLYLDWRVICDRQLARAW